MDECRRLASDTSDGCGLHSAICIAVSQKGGTRGGQASAGGTRISEHLEHMGTVCLGIDDVDEDCWTIAKAGVEQWY